MNDPYEIHKAIARNATIRFSEPGDGPNEHVNVDLTCSEIIALRIAYEQQVFAERNYPEDRERQSVNSMILDHIVVNWAHIIPEAQSPPPNEFVSTQQGCNQPEHTCKFCGCPSHIDPSDQSPPQDYCHPSDHGM
jgi:hypothetical protein